MFKRTKASGDAAALVVHHINGDEQDNRPGNLMLCTRVQREALLRQLEKLAFELVSQGKIVLKDGQYQVNPASEPSAGAVDAASAVTTEFEATASMDSEDETTGS